MFVDVHDCFKVSINAHEASGGVCEELKGYTYGFQIVTNLLSSNYFEN